MMVKEKEVLHDNKVICIIICDKRKVFIKLGGIKVWKMKREEKHKPR